MTRQAHSIEEFCEAHGICRATLYNLWKSGDGPRFMHVGRRRLITDDAASDWRHEMEVKAARDEAEAAP
jgi:predicted DNA-binding transcriptional regulator AlpA